MKVLKEVAAHAGVDTVASTPQADQDEVVVKEHGGPDARRMEEMAPRTEAHEQRSARLDEKMPVAISSCPVTEFPNPSQFVAANVNSLVLQPRDGYGAFLADGVEQLRMTKPVVAAPKPVHPRPGPVCVHWCVSS